MKELERQLKALANRRRLGIVKFLGKAKSASVGEIAKEIKLSFKSTSRHLAVLRSADIVSRDQASLQAIYSLHNAPHPISRYIISQC